jgi:hypothetical protein
MRYCFQKRPSVEATYEHKEEKKVDYKEIPLLKFLRERAEKKIAERKQLLKEKMKAARDSGKGSSGRDGGKGAAAAATILKVGSIKCENRVLPLCNASHISGVEVIVSISFHSIYFNCTYVCLCVRVRTHLCWLPVHVEGSNSCILHTISSELCSKVNISYFEHALYLMTCLLPTYSDLGKELLRAKMPTTAAVSEEAVVGKTRNEKARTKRKVSEVDLIEAHLLSHHPSRQWMNRWVSGLQQTSHMILCDKTRDGCLFDSY